ncbi:STAS domain-containing protein [Lampropedia aestuarii]|uniref:STAS domain-containing protein n=1 Tax=Lampropedia aestuarii TaxID=2562762 RepID=UPI002468DA9D|nr:STAS domain-containing protein [Lampropedia aestuarii]MDH5856591.1 STAS domain-containing protein [Lampropedia aestuarii]
MLNLQLPVRLTRDEVVGWVRDIEPLLKQAKASGETVAVDASALKQFDSSALAALLAVHRETQSLGVTFAGVQGMSVTLQSLAQVYGIDELLQQQPER